MIQPPELLQPVSYDPEALLQESYKREVESDFNISTRAKYTQRGEVAKDVHGPDKDLDPHVKPEHQTSSPVRPKTPRLPIPKPATPKVPPPPKQMSATPIR